MLKDFYNKNYKKLMLIPLIIFLLALLIIFLQYKNTGDIMNKDVSLRGGLTATLTTEKNIEEIKSFLQEKFPNTEFNIRKLSEFGSTKQTGIIIEVSELKDTELKQALQELGIEITDKNYSVEEVGSSLGGSFYRQMLRAILIAFLLMGLVVLITFRTLIPSVAVVSAALFDIVTALAVINLLGINLSMAGIAAFLLVIGYSIDTDIVLTTRVIKRKEGEIWDRIVNSAKTGLTMTATTLCALTIAYFISTSYVLKEMFLIIIIALLFDIISTYLFNAGILKWYAERKEVK